MWKESVNQVDVRNWVTVKLYTLDMCYIYTYIVKNHASVYSKIINTTTYVS